MGKGGNGTKHGTPKRNAGLPRRLDEDFELQDITVKSAKQRKVVDKAEVAVVKALVKEPVPSVKQKDASHGTRARHRPKTTSGKGALLESSWPRSSEQLWRWEPLVQRFDGIGDIDFSLLEAPLVKARDGLQGADITYRNLPSGKETLGLHYTRSWLKEDAKDVNELPVESYAASSPVEFDKPMLPKFRYVVSDDEIPDSWGQCETHRTSPIVDVKSSSPKLDGDLSNPLSKQESKHGPTWRGRLGTITDASSPSADLFRAAASPMTEGSCCCDPVEGREMSVLSHLDSLPTPGTPASVDQPAVEISGNREHHHTRSKGTGLQAKSPATAKEAGSTEEEAMHTVKLVFKEAGRPFNVEAVYNMQVRKKPRRSPSKQSEKAGQDVSTGELVDYELRTEADEGSEKEDELSTEILRLRKELFVAVKKHHPLRQSVKLGAIEKLKEEEKTIAEHLRRLKDSKLKRRKKKPKLCKSSEVKNEEGEALLEGADAVCQLPHSSQNLESEAPTTEEYIELKELRGNLVRLKDAADKIQRNQRKKRNLFVDGIEKKMYRTTNCNSSDVVNERTVEQGKATAVRNQSDCALREAKESTQGETVRKEIAEHSVAIMSNENTSQEKPSVALLGAKPLEGETLEENSLRRKQSEEKPSFDESEEKNQEIKPKMNSTEENPTTKAAFPDEKNQEIQPKVNSTEENPTTKAALTDEKNQEIQPKVDSTEENPTTKAALTDEKNQEIQPKVDSTEESPTAKAALSDEVTSSGAGAPKPPP